MKWPRVFGKLARKGKRHLEYDSIEAWFDGEGITVPLLQIQDPTERSRRLDEFGELRQQVFDLHLKSLPPDEQELFRQQRHPSQNHAFADAARSYAASLWQELLRVEDVRDVQLNFLQTNRIGLVVLLDHVPTFPEELQRPWLYRGFEIYYRGPKAPELTSDDRPQGNT